MNLAAVSDLRQLRVGLSPVWLFGALIGAIVYYLFAPSLAPQKPVMKKEMVISAPVSAPMEKPPVTEPSERPVASLDQSQPPSQPRVQPKTALPALAAAIKVDPAVRPITKADLSIKRRGSRKTEPGKDLKIYLEEGRNYLAEGDFEGAVLAYNFAILIDPRNEEAIRGMQAAQAGVKDVGAPASPLRETQSVPGVSAGSLPMAENEAEKKRLVKLLFERATAAVLQKKYQKAIDTAEDIRRVEIRGETIYLNEAKQIIDQAKIKQKDELEPFLNQANGLMTEGAYRTARELCDQILQRDDSYKAARECRDRADAELSRQATTQGGGP